MRLMLILRGAPGSGKSTLVQNLGLDGLSLGYDRFRDLFATLVPCQDGPGDKSLSWVPRLRPETERAVVAAAHEALEAHLADGATVVWDATSLDLASQKKLVARGRKHGYTSYVVDVQGDLPFKELAERNRDRGPRRVDESRLRDMWEAGRDKTAPEGVTVLEGTAAAVSDALLLAPGDHMIAPTVHADRVVVVGDVHSCAVPLREAVAELDAPGTHWVFAGDLFDRGPDPVGVWDLVHGLLAEGRATVVTGNHELNLRAVCTNTARAPFADTRETRDALLAHGVMAAEQAAFVDATVPLVLIPAEARPDGGPTRPWLVTHGGVGESTAARARGSMMHLVSDVECVYGLGDRAHTYRGKTAYDVGAFELAGRQLHGHRNGAVGGEPVATVRETPDGPVVCLEAGASTGGHVRVAVLTKGSDAPEIHEYADGVDASAAEFYSRMPWLRRKEPALPLLERMRASEHVNVRPVEGWDGVVAANFTRKAFQDGAWDDVSVHARGLFMDASTGEVLARGYEKFFHVGEEPGRDRAQWEDPSVTAYPVRAVKKYNGYLVLVASIHGALAVFSKSGATPYAEAARRMLMDQLTPQGCMQLKEMLERTGVTAAFEALRSDDPHPITEEGPDRLVLLDAIRNQEDFRTDDRMARNIARRFSLELAHDSVLGVAEGPEGLEALVAAAEHDPCEGAVLVDAKGYRSKVKAAGYTARKAARTALERYWRGASDTLGQANLALERSMASTCLLEAVRAGAFDVVGLDGTRRLDLAGVFDALERARH